MNTHIKGRRGAVAVAALAAVGVAVPVVVTQTGGASAAEQRAAAPVAAVAKAPAYVEYHAKSKTYHLATGKKLARSGYRPISLNVSDRANPRYAAVWVKRSGPAFTQVVGQTRATFQKSFTNLRKKGYQPITITATGSGASGLYSGIFEKKKGAFFSWGDLTAAKLAQHNKYAVSKGFIPISIDAYGTAKAPRYLAVWVANPRKVKWSVSLNKSFAAHDKLFKAQVKKGWRPSFVAVGSGYTAIWRNDKIGPWVELTGMTSAVLTARLKQAKAKGYYPIQIAGGGTGASSRYAAIWRK
ncbi:hypothetical protein [Actinomadura rudentiformis]|uniref:Uncharacterized protein n=1 Tax=Actinomadura rudentiformis TaxID=359158 RepID=A0A6H9YRX4_9ACTN|nr:hypothetical protein [Actinomadura rudentiformis]KAB2345982.1 hypothetical protein F8566_25000 [Actinomadura rudentiformis]